MLVVLFPVKDIYKYSDVHDLSKVGGEHIKFLRKLREDMKAEGKAGVLIGIVVLVIIAAVLFPLVNTQVQDLTDNTSANYVGNSTAGIVAMIPIFYWLMIALVVIGAAVVSIKDAV